MAVPDLSAKQLEKLVRRLGSTADAYKEVNLMPPPQVISELRRAKQLYEQKRVPPKPDVEKQYNLTVGWLNDFGMHFADYMDQEISPESYVEKIESFRTALKEMQDKVDDLEKWKLAYAGREE
jgi:hypothetical protein